MKFDLFGIIMMIIAVALGQFVGSMLIGYLGSLGGGLMGTFLVGVICYVVYAFITGSKFSVISAVIFSVLIYIANLAAGYVDSVIGLGGGLLTLVVTGVIASFLWGWVGGKGKKGALGLKVK